MVIYVEDEAMLTFAMPPRRCRRYADATLYDVAPRLRYFHYPSIIRHNIATPLPTIPIN